MLNSAVCRMESSWDSNNLVKIGENIFISKQKYKESYKD